MLEVLIRVDPGIADVKSNNNCTLLHLAVHYNSSSCAEVLLKLAPHLFDVVETSNNCTPIKFAKRYYPGSRKTITMLEDHQHKNR